VPFVPDTFFLAPFPTLDVDLALSGCINWATEELVEPAPNDFSKHLRVAERNRGQSQLFKTSAL
jgi:hypothetical protein